MNLSFFSGFEHHLLSQAIWTPIILGVLLFLMAKCPLFALNDSDDNNNTKNQDNTIIQTRVYRLGTLFAFISLLATIPVYLHFTPNTPLQLQNFAWQLAEKYSWIPSINAFYSLGIDGISVWFIGLTALTIFLILFGTGQNKPISYHANFLILSGLTIATFCAVDGLLFYLFFEATLIPMYLLIGIFGGPRRVYAAFKFFLYTLFGSLLALIALIYMYQSTQTFDLIVWQNTNYNITTQYLLFGAFFMAFAVKIPMWPVHTWLPDAHVEAPTGGSMILAAIMLKLGGYGFLRFALPLLHEASLGLAPVVIVLSLIAIVYIGFIALAQEDMKKLVAYSSIAHMGFVTLGIFLFNEWGLIGAMMQMISHGFISAGMFFCIGVLYDRVHSRQIKDYGGVAQKMPRFTLFMVLFAMANCGLPATSGFIGEFMVILASFQTQNYITGIFAATALIIGAAYSLWLVKRVMFGAITHEYIHDLKDLDCRETIVLSILAIGTIVLGVCPQLISGWFANDLAHLIQ